MLVQRYLGPQRPAVPQKLNLKRRRTAAEVEKDRQDRDRLEVQIANHLRAEHILARKLESLKRLSQESPSGPRAAQSPVSGEHRRDGMVQERLSQPTSAERRAGVEEPHGRTDTRFASTPTGQSGKELPMVPARRPSPELRSTHISRAPKNQSVKDIQMQPAQHSSPIVPTSRASTGQSERELPMMPARRPSPELRSAHISRASTNQSVKDIQMQPAQHSSPVMPISRAPTGQSETELQMRPARLPSPELRSTHIPRASSTHGVNDFQMKPAQHPSSIGQTSKGASEKEVQMRPARCPSPEMRSEYVSRASTALCGKDAHIKPAQHSSLITNTCRGWTSHGEKEPPMRPARLPSPELRSAHFSRASTNQSGKDFEKKPVRHSSPIVHTSRASTSQGEKEPPMRPAQGPSPELPSTHLPRASTKQSVKEPLIKPAQRSSPDLQSTHIPWAPMNQSGKEPSMRLARGLSPELPSTHIPRASTNQNGNELLIKPAQHSSFIMHTSRSSTNLNERELRTRSGSAEPRSAPMSRTSTIQSEKEPPPWQAEDSCKEVEIVQERRASQAARELEMWPAEDSFSELELVRDPLPLACNQFESEMEMWPADDSFSEMELVREPQPSVNRTNAAVHKPLARESPRGPDHGTFDFKTLVTCNDAIIRSELRADSAILVEDSCDEDLPSSPFRIVDDPEDFMEPASPPIVEDPEDHMWWASPKASLATMLFETDEPMAPKDTREFQDRSDSVETIDLLDTSDFLDATDFRDTREFRDTRNSRDTREVRYYRTSRDTKEVRDIRNFRDAREFRNTREPSPKGYQPPHSRQAKPAMDLKRFKQHTLGQLVGWESVPKPRVTAAAMDAPIQIVKIPKAPLPAPWGKIIKPLSRVEEESKTGTLFIVENMLATTLQALANIVPVAKYEAILAHPPWNRPGVSVHMIARYLIELVYSARFRHVNMLFVWAPKGMVKFRFMEALKSRYFLYVENLIWVRQGPNNRPAVLDQAGCENSTIVTTCHETLLIFRRTNSEVDLKHQRNPDVVYDFARPPRTWPNAWVEPKPPQVYETVETMLPEAAKNSRLIELWCPETTARDGWCRIGEIL